MTKEDFQAFLNKYADQIDHFRQMAHDLHQSVNQTYAGSLPYGFHLDMVVEGVRNYGYLVCVREEDVLPLLFGAYYHDSIEDARLTYNDVKKIALQYMNEEQAFMAAEIVYALTNDKGRTREERAGEKYYQGIRETPYAPFVKLADRLANITYSFRNHNDDNVHMAQVYRQELPHFLDAIDAHSDDVRFRLPETMLEEINKLVHSVNQEKSN